MVSSCKAPHFWRHLRWHLAVPWRCCFTPSPGTRCRRRHFLVPWRKYLMRVMMLRRLHELRSCHWKLIWKEGVSGNWDTTRTHYANGKWKMNTPWKAVSEIDFCDENWDRLYYLGSFLNLVDQHAWFRLGSIHSQPILGTWPKGFIQPSLRGSWRQRINLRYPFEIWRVVLSFQQLCS